MQEDDKEANGSQPESEGQPPSESEADEGQPQPQGQPPPESEAGESQPKAGTQPSTATPIPPARPIALPPTQRRKRWQYFLGLVLGLIPVIVFLVGYGFALGTTGGALNALGPLAIGLLLYFVELLIMIGFLNNKDRRFAGYGLLTAFLATPIVVAIGCSVLPNVIHA